MSMLVSFVLSFFPRDVLDEILNLIGSVSEGFPSYSCKSNNRTLEGRFFLKLILVPNGVLIYNMHILLTSCIFII